MKLTNQPLNSVIEWIKEHTQNEKLKYLCDYQTNAKRDSQEAPYTLEVCADCTESALEAAENGATRLELCANLVIGGTTPSLELFREIRRFIEYREQLGMFVVAANLLGNILIFVPYGFFVSMAGRTRGFFKTFFYSMFLSLAVETVQLVTRVGSFDVDDILLNTIGGVLGYIAFVLCNGIRRRHNDRNRKKR